MKDVLSLLFIYGVVAILFVGGIAIIIQRASKIWQKFLIPVLIAWTSLSFVLTYFFGQFHDAERFPDYAWGTLMIGGAVVVCYAHAVWTMVRGQKATSVS
jgi:hypothetical protein